MADKECCPSPEHLDQQAVSADDPSTASRRSIRQLTRAVRASLRLSFVLENKGNVARDHLASERTYLTYVQTSLACASAGIVLVQLFMLSTTRDAGADKLARPLGAFIVLFGLVILVYGLVRYFRTQGALLRGCFSVAQGSVVAMALVLASLVGVVFGVIVAGTPS